MPIGIGGSLANGTVNNPSSIVLVLSHVARTLTWYGGNSANWDTSTANWDSGADTYTEVGGIGDNVIFPDSSAPAVTTNINLTKALSPASVAINTDNVTFYNFAGPGSLAGPGALTFAGGGVARGWARPTPSRAAPRFRRWERCW